MNKIKLGFAIETLCHLNISLVARDELICLVVKKYVYEILDIVRSVTIHHSGTPAKSFQIQISGYIKEEFITFTLHTLSDFGTFPVVSDVTPDNYIYVYTLLNDIMLHRNNIL